MITRFWLSSAVQIATIRSTLDGRKIGNSRVLLAVSSVDI